jgi:hypothetical protein
VNRWRAVVLAIAVIGPTAAGAIGLLLDARAIQDAITLGQSTLDNERLRFHAPYRVIVGHSPVDYFEIVTPFRQVVLAAEGRARQGDRRFGPKDATDLLDTEPARLRIQLELTFHPLNVYVGIPDYLVVLVQRTGAPIEPLRLDRIPRFGPRTDAMPPASSVFGGLVPGTATRGRSQPMLGGTIIAIFDGRALDAIGSYAVTVREGGQELTRTGIDLGRLR